MTYVSTERVLFKSQNIICGVPILDEKNKKRHFVLCKRNVTLIYNCLGVGNYYTIIAPLNITVLHHHRKSYSCTEGFCMLAFLELRDDDL